MLEVVLVYSDGTPCAIAKPASMQEASKEAITMSNYGENFPVLRTNGIPTAYWINNAWKYLH